MGCEVPDFLWPKIFRRIPSLARLETAGEAVDVVSNLRRQTEERGRRLLRLHCGVAGRGSLVVVEVDDLHLCNLKAEETRSRCS